jgi:hypothetical protein
MSSYYRKLGIGYMYPVCEGKEDFKAQFWYCSSCNSAKCKKCGSVPERHDLSAMAFSCWFCPNNCY